MVPIHNINSTTIKTTPKMSRLVDRCKEYDPNVVLVICQAKDDHVICYNIKENRMVPYWRMSSGVKKSVSYLEGKMAFDVQQVNQQMHLVGAPHIIFVLDGLTILHANKPVHFVFLGQAKGYFDRTPSYITIHYRDKSQQKIVK